MIDGSRHINKVALPFRVGFVLVLAILMIIAYRRTRKLAQPSAFAVTDKQQEIADTAPVFHYYTAELQRKLARRLPFDTAVGDMMGGIVPIEDVPQTERTNLRRLWASVIAPAFGVRENGGIEWRKLRWSKVRWRKPGRRRKQPTPPETDECVARWFIDGSAIIVSGTCYQKGTQSIGITISLTGSDRLHFEYPRLEDLGFQPPSRVVVGDIDKTRLLTILTSVFQFPWHTIDDFEVLWSPSPTSVGHLRIESTRHRQPGEPEAWFDEVSLHIRQGNPQKLSFTVVFLRR